MQETIWAEAQTMPPRKVLMIEDHPDVAAMLQKMTELAGHEVRVCRTGFEALDVAPDFNPEIVLLDLGLPDMDGWQVARAFRKNCLLSKAKIIAVSAYQTELDKLQSLAVGIDQHLGKPIHQFEILLAIAGDSPWAGGSDDGHKAATNLSVH